MDPDQFDVLVNRFAKQVTRRSSLGVLGLLGVASVRTGREAGAGKKGKKKKKPLCLNGETIKASSKKRKQLLKQGATTGSCVPPGPCACASTEVCHDGVCQACTVTCTGDAIACGAQLQQSLLDGGTIYACPGRYQGQFSVGTARLIGAGKGENPASSTILDAAGTGRTLTITANALAELFSVRITGGKVLNDSGAGILAGSSDLRLTNCAVVNNEAGYGGGGVYTQGPVRLTKSIVSDNKANYGGGIYLFGNVSSFITDSVISGNRSTNFQGDGGGGMLSSQSAVTIVGTEISGNMAAQGGGGIQTYQGIITLNAACRLLNNSVSLFGPGAIYAIAPGSVAVNGATVSGNTDPQCLGTTC